MRRVVSLLALASIGAIHPAAAQEKAPQAPVRQEAPAASVRLGALDASVLWRSRLEVWRWFETDAADSGYTYLNSLVRAGVGQSRPALDWRIEVSQPSFLGAPDNAVATPPQGALGLGAAYFGANESRTRSGSLFLKQAYLHLKQLPGSTMKVGRFEFFDATEVRNPDPTVAALVQSRVGHRLVSNEAFPAAQRSFDGALLTWSSGNHALTGFAARPTAGGVHLSGWKELAIEVYYGAYNRTVRAAAGAGSFRVFAAGYVDRREAAKPDNRPAPIRSADGESIGIATYGANYVHVIDAGAAGRFDVTGWGAVQTGSWGALSQRAAAGFGEFGWQPAEPRLRPWIRAGFSHSGGDDDPADGRHGTFYQLFGATRQYAKFPFYNLMNVQDAYALVALRPRPTVTVRTEVHDLRLASAADLWYGGGGPGRPDVFGYGGRPGGGSRSLATLWDVSADMQPLPHFGVNLYYGRAWGHEVITNTYPDGGAGHFGFVETVVRF